MRDCQANNAGQFQGETGRFLSAPVFLATFGFFWPILPLLAHTRPFFCEFFLISWHFFSTILGHSWRHFWILLTHFLLIFGHFWAVLATFGCFWMPLALFGKIFLGPNLDHFRGKSNQQLPKVSKNDPKQPKAAREAEKWPMAAKKWLKDATGVSKVVKSGQKQPKWSTAPKAAQM